MNDVEIRKATNKDSSSIVDLIFDIWRNEYGFDVAVSNVPDLIDIENAYHADKGLFMVALHEGVIVGTIACSKLSNTQYVLKRMFVMRSHRRQGIAQLLLDALLNELIHVIDNNKLSLLLSTKEGEARAAKAFYRKNGFIEIDKSMLPENFPYFYEDDLFMMHDDLRLKK